LRLAAAALAWRERATTALAYPLLEINFRLLRIFSGLGICFLDRASQPIIF
jgi:hypothetical protein